MSPRYRAIYAAVAKIPKGRVASYGQIAKLAGIPRHARQVGYALFNLPDHLSIPWHRVINAKGEISKRSFDHYEKIQRKKLEREGVVFGAGGRVAKKFFAF